jgi:uncharacterized protein YjdB
MKTWKQRVFGTWVFTAIAVIIVAGLIFTGCKDGNEEVNTDVAVTGVALNEYEHGLMVGEEFELTATVSPAGATNKAVTWSTSKSSVATVTVDSKTGVATVKGVATGEADITVVTKSGGKRAICAVTVSNIVVTHVNLDATLALEVGESQRLYPSVLPERASIGTPAWESDDETVATVTSNGTVTAEGVGEANIKVTIREIEATCKVTVSAVSVSGVTLSAKTLTINGKDTKTLTATVEPSNAANKAVTWVSDAPGIATVSVDPATGIATVTSVSAGKANIKVTTTGLKKAEEGEETGEPATDECVVTVTDVAVTSVTLNRKTLGLVVDDQETLTVEVLPVNRLDKGVTWSSSDDTKATVDQTGKVTGKSATVVGTPVIITVVSTTNSAMKDTCSVIVGTTGVSDVTLNKNTLNLKIGEGETLLPTVEPEEAVNKDVEWDSDDETVATVNAAGYVEGVGEGTATITVTTVNGRKTAQCVVNVTPVPVTGVTLNETTLSLKKGEEVTLTAEVAPEIGTIKTVKWESSDPSKVEVNTEGKVKAKAATTTPVTITVTTDGKKEDGSPATATCTVTVVVPVTSVTLNRTELTLQRNTSGTSATGTLLYATVLPEDATNQTVSWSSAATARATVVGSGDGNRTGTVSVPNNAANTAVVITVTAADGKTAECTVYPQQTGVTGLTVNPTSLTLYAGGATGTITPTVTPTNATWRRVRWEIIEFEPANEADKGKEVVTINNYSLTTDNAPVIVTPKVVGTAKLKVTTLGVRQTAAGGMAINEPYTTTVTVTVNAREPVTGVTLNKSATTLVAGTTETLTAEVAPSNASDKNLTWSSSATAIATVNASGVVTGVTPGSATITATSNDNPNAKAECVVTVTPAAVTSVQLYYGSQYYSSIAFNPVAKGATITTYARVNPAGAIQTVTVQSDRPDLATAAVGALANNGYTVTVTCPGVGGGTAIITVISDGLKEDGTKATTTITIPINDPDADPAVINGVGLLNSGTYVQGGLSGGPYNYGTAGTLTYARVLPTTANPRTVTMVSDRPDVVTVQNGVYSSARDDTPVTISCVGAGTAVITISSVGLMTNNKPATTTVTITVAPTPVAGISLDKTALGLNIGDTETLTPVFNPPYATNKAVTWSVSSTPAGAVTVSQAGLVTAVAAGTATVTVKAADGGFEATCAVTVVAVGAVGGVSLNKEELELFKGETGTLIATVTPESATNKAVTWSTSNGAVATVNNGLVTAVGPGKATITATSVGDDTKKAECEVTVLSMLAEMATIPAGTFSMGSTTATDGNNRGADEVVHDVTLKGFYMGKYEVTQKWWELVMGEEENYSAFPYSDSTYANRQKEFPVENLSWYEAIIFCNILSMKEGVTPAYEIPTEANDTVWSTNPATWGDIPDSSGDSRWDQIRMTGSEGYRLPTEAEWEYACRGNAATKTAWNTGSGNIQGTQAQFDQSAVKNQTVPVGMFATYANAFGLNDMHGNVVEWCWDWYGALTTAAANNPTGAATDGGDGRVIRGGAWWDARTWLRSACRDSLPPGYWGYPNQGGGLSPVVGFRVVRNLPSAPSTKIAVPSGTANTQGVIVVPRSTNIQRATDRLSPMRPEALRRKATLE